MTLMDLLDASGQYDAEFDSAEFTGLSNHLPMALAALKRLGADDARLAEFAARYSQRLRPAPAAAEWPTGEPWRARLGQPGAWPAYRHLFLHWLVTEDADAVLQQTLPTLMAGCGGAAFHGLIRTAYALQAGHGQELADALAYWACRWLDLGPPPPSGRRADPAPLLKALARPRPAGEMIVDRMIAAAGHPGFGADISGLRIDENTLPRLARLAARLYARSGNFTALHLVTSAQAMTVLLPFIDEPVPAAAAYWRAYAAGFVASGAVLGRAPSARPWPELMATARVSDDDHLIKLVDACRQAQMIAGGADDWQRAATRATQGAVDGA